MAIWPAQDVSEHLEELLDEADAHGPQIISCDGHRRSVVLSIHRYRELLASRAAQVETSEPPYADFKDWLLNGPKFEDGFEVERNKDTGRDFEFE